MATGMGFPLPLQGQIIGNGHTILLLAPFVFEDDGMRIEVPAGFETDLNSSPRPLWLFFSPWDYPAAGVVHDFLYRASKWTDRRAADKVHRRILELSGCSLLRRWAAYVALRAFGWIYWGSLPD